MVQKLKLKVLRANCADIFICSFSKTPHITYLESREYAFCNDSDFVNLRFRVMISSVQFSCSVVSYSLLPHGLQHARLPSPSPTPGAYSNSCPESNHLLQSSLAPFSSCLQSFPASGSFPLSLFFASGGQSFGVSTSASMNIHD